MKRILFVDDEQNILDGLENILRKQRKEWTMAFALGGEAALERLRSAPFDVVVSDMRMPGMDGATLLKRVKDEFPSVVRIVLSGYAERESMIRSLPVAHQFLAKPCEAEALRNVIERACALRRLLSDETLRRMVGSIDRLPSFPRAYWELTAAMANPSPSIREISAIIEQDPQMCAKVLQLVNSSHFVYDTHIAGIEAAVGAIGIDVLRSLTVVAQVFAVLDDAPPIPGFSYEALQLHALTTAKAAKRIGTARAKDEEAFTAGLLHDIGKVILAIGLPERFAEVLAASRRDNVPMHTKELEMLGVSHAEVGAYLLGLWGLPSMIVEAVAYHHSPATVEQRSFDLLGAVHVADALTSPKVPSIERTACEPLDIAYLDSLGLTAEIPKWQTFIDDLARSSV